ncbi:MAG: O-antigen ligase family protein, partial [Eubacterium sp.]
MKAKNKNYLFFLYAVVALFPFSVGGYYVFYCALASIILSCGLLIHFFKEKQIVFSLSFEGIFFSVVCFLYLITKLWAVDSSMSIHGFLKYLCLLLFIFSLLQIDKESRARLLNVVPLSATVMTALSVLLGLFDSLKLKFYDSVGDLHGFFEYANAFAIFLLVGIVIAIFNYKSIILKIICVLVSAYGIWASNSRAVWALSALVLFAILLYFLCNRAKNKKKAIISAIVILFAFSIAAIVILHFTGYLDKIFNYINTDGSLNERYLYYKDALLYSLKHPFGKGFYAFYYAQPQFQSARYYAIDVHCDVLQMMIEIGIAPALAFVVLIVKQLFGKGTSPVQKFVLLTLFLHSLIDYDLQFMSLFFILALCIEFSNEKAVKLKSKLIVLLICICIFIFNAVVGLSTFYNYTGKHDKSVYFYKNTSSLLVLMQSTNQQQIGYDYANEILDINDNIFEANNVLSNIYAENNDFDNAIEQMEFVIEKDPRTIKHYEDYVVLCDTAYKYYK